jgi:hypothetical protein
MADEADSWRIGPAAEQQYAAGEQDHHGAWGIVQHRRRLPPPRCREVLERPVGDVDQRKGQDDLDKGNGMPEAACRVPQVAAVGAVSCDPLIISPGPLRHDRGFPAGSAVQSDLSAITPRKPCGANLTMKEALRRWGRRSLWALPAVFALYLIVTCVDFVWYRTHIPVRFQSVNWEGRWETRRYGGLSGRLLVHLPDPLPEGVDFQAEALVYYPVYSVWKTGQFVKMDFMGHFHPGSPASGGQTTNSIPAGGYLKFKGVAGRQEVDYTALLDDSRSIIIGSYLSRWPDDYGHFEIDRY